ncbi:MAG: PAS domain S-box protein [Kiritimatiellae bacterium]|nr:PAS domain S-box protein [Kiritimatiellia bacterium]
MTAFAARLAGVQAGPGWLPWLLAGGAALALLAAAAMAFNRLLKMRTAQLLEVNERLRREAERRKQTLRALSESEQKFRGIFNKAFQFLGLLRPDGTIIELNRTALRFSGVNREDLVDQPFWEMPWWEGAAEERERVRAAIGRAAQGEFVRYEVDVQGAGNRAMTVDLSITPVKDEHENVVLLIPEGRNVSARKRTRQRLLAYQEELRALTLELSLAEEAERKRLASALHDSVGQSIALVNMKLEQLIPPAGDEEAPALLGDVHRLLDETLRQLRTLTFELSPPILYELGLGAALEWLCDHFQRLHPEVLFSFNADGEPETLDESIRTLVFQAARELLTNAAKHARATRVNVRMAIQVGCIAVEVRDDGVGFDLAALPACLAEKQSYGIFSVRERIRYVGGTVRVQSEPGKGTTVSLSAPVRPVPSAEKGVPCEHESSVGRRS